MIVFSLFNKLETANKWYHSLLQLWDNESSFAIEIFAVRFYSMEASLFEKICNKQQGQLLSLVI